MGWAWADVKMMAMVGAFLGVRGAFHGHPVVARFLGSIVGGWPPSPLYSFGWRRALAERAHRRGLGGSVTSLRWTLASQYQLPLGTFLGLGAFFVVYGFPWFLSHFYFRLLF